MEDYDAAYAAFDDAALQYRNLGLSHNEADCLNRLANAYLAQKLYSKAAEAYGRAIELLPGEAMWYRNRGNTYIEMGDFEAAAADLADAATLQPDHPYLLLRRGDLAFEQGHYAEAASHYRQFIAGLPSVHGGHFGLGCALLGLSQEEAGLDEIQQALARTFAPREIKEFAEKLEEFSARQPDLSGLAEALALVRAWRPAANAS